MLPKFLVGRSGFARSSQPNQESLVPVFSGNFKYTFDSKGRVNIPAQFRNQLLEKPDDGFDSQDSLFFHITYGNESCLYVYPRSVFRNLVERWEPLSDPLMGNEDDDKVQLYRRLMAFAQPCRGDQQGRIIIPKEYIDYAGIDTEVLIVGMGNRIELWNPETFNHYIKK